MAIVENTVENRAVTDVFKSETTAERKGQEAPAVITAINREGWLPGNGQ